MEMGVSFLHDFLKTILSSKYEASVTQRRSTPRGSW